MLEVLDVLVDLHRLVIDQEVRLVYPAIGDPAELAPQFTELSKALEALGLPPRDPAQIREIETSAILERSQPVY